MMNQIFVRYYYLAEKTKAPTFWTTYCREWSCTPTIWKRWWKNVPQTTWRKNGNVKNCSTSSCPSKAAAKLWHFTFWWFIFLKVGCQPTHSRPICDSGDLQLRHHLLQWYCRLHLTLSPKHSPRGTTTTVAFQSIFLDCQKKDRKLFLLFCAFRS